jgi:putative FmdB family regulatory protein
MPDYSFICQKCGAHFNEHLSFNSDRSQLTCPNGHHSVQRIYTPPQVTFKGSGFYVTDSKKEKKTS